MSIWESTKSPVRMLPLHGLWFGRTAVTEPVPPAEAVGRMVASLLHEIAEGLQSAGFYVAAARHETPGSTNLSPDRVQSLAKALEQLTRTNDAFARLKSCLAPVLVKPRDEN